MSAVEHYRASDLIREPDPATLLLHHIDGSQILAEDTLALILNRLAARASMEAGHPVSFNIMSALRTLSLVVTA